MLFTHCLFTDEGIHRITPPAGCPAAFNESLLPTKQTASENRVHHHLISPENMFTPVSTHTKGTCSILKLLVLHFVNYMLSYIFNICLCGVCFFSLCVSEFPLGKPHKNYLSRYSQPDKCQRQHIVHNAYV